MESEDKYPLPTQSIGLPARGIGIEPTIFFLFVFSAASSPFVWNKGTALDLKGSSGTVHDEDPVEEL